MIAIPRPRDTIESTAPSSSASTVAAGVHSCAAHQSPGCTRCSSPPSRPAAASAVPDGRPVHQRVLLLQQHSPDQLLRYGRTRPDRRDPQIGAPVEHLARRPAPHLAHHPHHRFDPGVAGPEPLQCGRQQEERRTAEGGDPQRSGHRVRPRRTGRRTARLGAKASVVRRCATPRASVVPRRHRADRLCRRHADSGVPGGPGSVRLGSGRRGRYSGGTDRPAARRRPDHRQHGLGGQGRPPHRERRLRRGLRPPRRTRRRATGEGGARRDRRRAGSPRCATMDGSPGWVRSPSTTPPTGRRPPRATCTTWWAGACGSKGCSSATTGRCTTSWRSSSSRTCRPG